jgi:hypothetical protein
MARLREKARHIRKGHVARLEETRHWYDKLPKSAQKKAAADLARRYRQLIDTDKRLERLDKMVAKTAKTIMDLTREAERALAQGEYRRLERLVGEAEKHQKHNGKILKAIERTDVKLMRIVEHVATESRERVS